MSTLPRISAPTLLQHRGKQDPNAGSSLLHKTRHGAEVQSTKVSTVTSPVFSEDPMGTNFWHFKQEESNSRRS